MAGPVAGDAPFRRPGGPRRDDEGDPAGSEPKAGPRDRLAAYAGTVRRSLRPLWPLLAALLVAVVVAQELRWQLHEPWRLAGVSHAVGVPVGVPLTAGYTLVNASRLPLEVVDITVGADSFRPNITETHRLEVLSVVVTPDQRQSPALRGTPFELGLTTAPVEGRRVAAGEELVLAATYVGTGPHPYRAGPITITYGFGPWTLRQEVPLSRGYRVVVEAPLPTATGRPGK